MVLLSAWIWLAVAPCQAQIGWREGFETPQTSWLDAGGDGRYKLSEHRRSMQGAHGGVGCETLVVDVGSSGSFIYLSHDIGRAPVIPELVPSVWVRADRPGIRIFARVVFPRTPDPRSGAPISTLLVGTTYSKVGNWEQLYLEDVPTLVARQSRVLRSQLKSAVDGREAYIDRVLLNVFTGPGRANISIDDLEIAGHVVPPPPQVAGAPPTAPPEQVRPRASVELNGSVFMAEGRPFFPRAIEYQGEPLSFLRELGFNTIKFGQLPTPALLAEAQRLALWLICPPERPPGLGEVEISAQLLEPVGPQYERVLAWHMGENLTGRELAATKRWVEQVRRADNQAGRPIICEAEAEVRAYSRLVDLLLMKRLPLGSTFELADYGTWLRERPRLARPGTPVWAVIQTQPAPELLEQWNLLGHVRPTSGACSSDQIRVLAYSALASGARGLCFQSSSPLSAADEATRDRATALALLNLELHVLEPWCAAGSVAANVPGSVMGAPLPVNQKGQVIAANRKSLSKRGISTPVLQLPEVNGVVLQTDRAQLLLPIWSSAGGQLVSGQSAGNGIAFVVPGVSESTDAHEITPGGLRPLKHQRVTGGIRITLDELGISSMVLMSQDPLVLANLVQRLGQTGRQAARLQRELTASRLKSVVELESQLTAAGQNASEAAGWIASARAGLEECDKQLGAGDARSAFLEARRALRPLGQLERLFWTKAIKGESGPLASPLTAAAISLPGHYNFIAQTKTGNWGRNRLAEGQFEDLDRMVWAGWQHYEHPQDGVRTEAELSSAAPKGGRYSLRMAAKAIDERAAAGLVETPPVWITSPAVQAGAGQWFRISGWVYVPEPITGSLDGLMIIDSLGGEPLAERLGEARQWRKFTMYRAAPRSGPLRVTMALTGFGEAWVDNVMIEPWLPPGTPPETIPPGNRSALIRLPALR
ncbi:MAG TPA: hypothetical protein VHY20_06795 [Pirellulales bacterium]|nr:hypothetical protein [Pirellulales bacterium]